MTETPRVLAEIAAERAAQDARWGESNHPDHVPNQGHPGVLAFQFEAIHWKNRNTHRANRGDLAWDGILLEEVFEACGATDVTTLRGELVHVAAVAAAWIEAIDRRSAPVAPAPERQWAVRRPDVSLCVHRSPHSVLYTAAKLPGGVIVTRMSDETEWQVETDCLCGRSKPIGWHYEACPATPSSALPTPGGKQ